MRPLRALLCLSIAAPAALSAQTTAAVTFTNGGSLTGHYVSDGHYYVGDYSGTVNGQAAAPMTGPQSTSSTPSGESSVATIR